VRRTLAIIAGIALGICFSQFPEYAQQFEQRLGGAVDELRIIVADLDRDAEKFGLSRVEALGRYAASPDDFIKARGMSMARTLARYEYLSGIQHDVETEGPLGRLVHLRDYLDSDIGQRAWAAYKPAMPTTVEGLFWALAGFLAGYGLTYPLLGALTLPFRWRRGQEPRHRVPLFWRT
jgi:hypothetical protein